MVTTGWLGSEEPGGTHAAGFADFILAHRAAPGEGHTLGQVFARAAQPDTPQEPYDDDDRQVALLTRGYRPGLLNELSRQLGDVQGELEAEKEKLAAAARRAAVIQRAHEARRLDAFGVMRALDEGDAGDEARVRLLERRASSLRHQIDDAMRVVSPPERQAPGPVEAAAQRAQQVAAAVAEEWRQRDAAGVRARVQLGRERSEFYAARGRHPFASRGAGRSTEHTGPDCWVCAEGRRRDAARDREDMAAYAPGAVITTGYAEAVR